MRIDYLKNKPQFAQELNRLCFAEWGYLIPGSSREDWFKKLKERMNDASIPYALVASENDQYRGTASILEYDMEDRPNLFPWLAAVYIKTEYRNCGVGTLLLNAIDTECRKLGYNRYYLYTAEAKNFYLKRGCTIVEERKYHEENVVIMVKDLTKSK